MELKQQGTTVLLNSHQLDQVERVCDRVAYVSRGRVEAIETVSAGAAATRVLRVRWATGDTPPAPETLAAACERAGSTLHSADATTARFSVNDDTGAARLIEALLAAGVRVIEVTPEEGRLERLFLEGAPR